MKPDAPRLRLVPRVSDQMTDLMASKALTELGDEQLDRLLYMVELEKFARDKRRQEESSDDET